MSSQESQQFQWHYTQLNDDDFQIKGRTLFFLIVLFSIVLLVTIFFLYARWVCRFNHFTTYHAPHAPPPRPPGLDNSTINALPITLHHQHHNQSKNNSESNSECCICLGVFEDGDKVKVLPRCHHCYHCECVDRWLMTHSSCPLCRASLRVDSVVVASIV